MPRRLTLSRARHLCERGRAPEAVLQRKFGMLPVVAPRTVVFIGCAFPTYLPWIRRPSGLRGRPANETYDAGLSLDVDRRIADNFVYSPRLGKHRHMA